jgi:NitT/TauT family transport system substrate-binding protein
LLVSALALAAAGCTPASTPAPAPAPAPAAAAAPASSTAASPSPAPLRPVRMAYGFVSTATLPMWIALDQGIYRKYGLDVDATYLQSSAQIAPAMAAGEVDVALTAGAGVVDIDLAGGDQVLILSQTQDLLAFFLHARPDVQGVEALRGKRVAITRLGSGVHLATQIVLQRAGIEAGRDTQLVQAGTVDAQLAALLSDGAEAAMMAAPGNFVAERQGFPLLADLRDYQVPYSPGALAVTRGALNAQYDLVRDFVQAHVEAMGLGRRNPELAMRLLAANTQTDDQDLLDKSYRLWLTEMTTNGVSSLAAVQTVLDQRAPDLPAARTADPRDFVDERIVRELDASGFLQRALSGPAQ